MYRLVAPCHFGMESILKREIQDLGYQIESVSDGRVTFLGDDEAIVRSNIFLRTAERVLLCVGMFKAFSFEELFQNVKALPWEDYLPKNAVFPVKKASSVNSKLFSSSDIQSITKKAIVERLKQKYHIEWFQEDGNEYPIRVFIRKDEVTVGIDTSGDSLHKRGYRTNTVKAPLSETLASAIILLSPWKRDRILVDPFCGSGTFPIEAAMIGANIAPGMNRNFIAEKWTNIIDKKLWYNAIDEANDLIIEDPDMDIQGYDLDPEVIKMARANARNAGVDHLVHFQAKDVADLSHRKKYGFIITNPPYGRRLLEEDDMAELYTIMGESFNRLDDWSYFILTAFTDAPKYIGREPDKNRKIYNGMMKTYLFEFFGAKPPKRKA